jgi:hypothetical protein
MKTNRKALTITLIAIAASLASISAFTFVYGALNATASPTTIYAGNNYPNHMSQDQWSNMMGNMMGGNWESTPTPTATTAQNSILPIIGFITLIGATLTGTGGAFYYFAGRPKITLSQTPSQVSPTLSTSIVNVESPMDSVSKTLTADEHKVVDVLTSHNGEYLQKYIRSETGLSRLKVHRIVTRLAERGIVTLEQSGNTNKVFLSSWLSKQPFSKINPQENTEHEMVIDA